MAAAATTAVASAVLAQTSNGNVMIQDRVSGVFFVTLTCMALLLFSLCFFN